MVKAGEAGAVKKEVVLSEKIAAPVAKGTEIGSITLRVNGEVAVTAPLVAEKDVPKVTFFGAILKLIRAMFSF